MAHQERLSISIDEQRASEMRKLVETGRYKTISAAFDKAAAILIERQAQEDAWWIETIRRCEEAERNPGQMVEAAALFDVVRSDVA